MTASCLPCCDADPAECACALEIPPFGGTYDFASAEAALLQVSNCIGFFDPEPETFSSTNPTSTTIEIDGTNSGGETFTAYMSITVPAAGTDLSIAFTLTPFGEEPVPVVGDIVVYACGTWTTVDSDSETGSSTGTLTITGLVEGTYYLAFTSENSTSSSFSLTSTEAIVVNPVIALWDDSGTTRQLEACPKTEIPLFGSWYVDETEAQDAIDGSTFDCKGYLPTPLITYGPDYSFSFSGTRATANASGDGNGLTVASGGMWFSVNLVGGDTLTLSGSASASVSCTGSIIEEIASINVTLYDSGGNLLETSQNDTLSGSSISTSDDFTVPYTGKFYVNVNGIAGVGYGPECEEPTYSGTVYGECTSDGDISANTIQALYDVGLTCPARLDC
jgi:hypothetical protein